MLGTWFYVIHHRCASTHLHEFVSEVTAKTSLSACLLQSNSFSRVMLLFVFLMYDDIISRLSFDVAFTNWKQLWSRFCSFPNLGTSDVHHAPHMSSQRPMSCFCCQMLGNTDARCNVGFQLAMQFAPVRRVAKPLF